MRDIWLTVRILWALRPVSERAMRRRMQRAASDPAFWEAYREAIGRGMSAAQAGEAFVRFDRIADVIVK